MSQQYSSIYHFKRCLQISKQLFAKSSWDHKNGVPLIHRSYSSSSTTSGESSSNKSQLRSVSSRGLTPSQAYNALVEKKEILEDAHQVEIIKAFDKLYKELGNYRPPARESSVSKYFSGIFGTSGGGANLKKMPKGLYIHGAVGGGKTFCMDLFYDVAMVQRKLRVHFHSFMSDVHSRIHRVKQETVHNYSDGTKPRVYDPIPPVAEEIADETWLLCFDEFQVSRFKLYFYLN